MSRKLSKIISLMIAALLCVAMLSGIASLAETVQDTTVSYGKDSSDPATKHTVITETWEYNLDANGERTSGKPVSSDTSEEAHSFVDGKCSKCDYEQAVQPTEAPTATPTIAPTAEPTEAPTAEPTVAPTAEPTEAPTAEPTAIPTVEPTAVPTVAPTAEPTATPTVAPSATPASDKDDEEDWDDDWDDDYWDELTEYEADEEYWATHDSYDPRNDPELSTSDSSSNASTTTAAETTTDEKETAPVAIPVTNIGADHADSKATLPVASAPNTFTTEEASRLSNLNASDQAAVVLAMLGYEDKIGNISSDASALVSDINNRFATEEEREAFVEALKASLPTETLTIDGEQITCYILEVQYDIDGQIVTERYAFYEDAAGELHLFQL